MEETKRNIDFFFGIAVVYFFFNSFLLPQGLLFTFILTPLFYYWLVKKGVKNLLGYFLMVLIPMFSIHAFIGVDYFYYFKSSVLYLFTYISVFGFYIFAKNYPQRIENVFGKLVILNFGMTLLALAFYFTPLRDQFWFTQDINDNISGVPRLKQLTYEASYYSTLLVPLVLYYLLGFFLKRYTINKVVFLTIFLGAPLLISFSLGVLASITFAVIASFVFFYKSLLKLRKVFYSLTGIFILVLFIGIVLLILFPDNPLYQRIADVLSGQDSSGKGRTTEAWKLSFQMIELKNFYFGCGLGQIKVVGEEVVRVFYNYQHDDIPVIRIPSATGETIAIFGVVGLVVRFALQFYLFFKTKVFTNYYRFSLFAFIFLYQFTGSYLTNLAEYVIWILAFVPGFHDFDKKNPR